MVAPGVTGPTILEMREKYFALHADMFRHTTNHLNLRLRLLL